MVPPYGLENIFFFVESLKSIFFFSVISETTNYHLLNGYLNVIAGWVTSLPLLTAEVHINW